MSDTADIWEQVAADYRIHTAPHLFQYAVDAIQLVGSRGDLLDVGCGTGEFVDRVHGSFRSVDAIDSSLGMLKVAREHVGSPVGFENLDIQESTPNRRYDIVTSFFCIMLLDNPEEALARIYSALRPNGELLFTVWVPPQESQAMRVFSKAMIAAGLSPPKRTWDTLPEITEAVRKAGFNKPSTFRISYPILAESPGSCWANAVKSNAFLRTHKLQHNLTEWKSMSMNAIQAITDCCGSNISLEAPAWLVHTTK